MLNKVDILEVNKLVFEYVMNLEEEDIIKLLTGENVLLHGEKNGKEKTTADNNNVEVTVKSKKEKAVKPIVKEKEESDKNTLIEEASKLLSEGTSREEAYSYFKKKVYTVKVLKDVAKNLDLYIKSKSTKAEIIEKLVEGTIGARLRIRALKEK